MKTIQNRFAKRGNSKLRVRNVSLNGEGRRNSATLETRGEFHQFAKVLRGAEAPSGSN